MIAALPKILQLRMPLADFAQNDIGDKKARVSKRHLKDITK